MRKIARKVAHKTIFSIYNVTHFFPLKKEVAFVTKTIIYDLIIILTVRLGYEYVGKIRSNRYSFMLEFSN
jgi:hypothetical protein